MVFIKPPRIAFRFIIIILFRIILYRIPILTAQLPYMIINEKILICVVLRYTHSKTNSSSREISFTQIIFWQTRKKIKRAGKIIINTQADTRRYFGCITGVPDRIFRKNSFAVVYDMRCVIKICDVLEEKVANPYL